MEENQNLIYGIKTSWEAPIVSHLLYVDDIVLLLRANNKKASNIKIVPNK